jgi:class 3 adenylate cyclase
MSTLVVYLYERLSRAEFQARQKLRQEQQRSERLLLNILPPSIAERLLNQQQTIADSFSEVTVLFADIVGFTQLSSEMSPAEVVELLNQVFSGFDGLAESYQLEKIKTIGRCSTYGVAGLRNRTISSLPPGSSLDSPGSADPILLLSSSLRLCAVLLLRGVIVLTLH